MPAARPATPTRAGALAFVAAIATAGCAADAAGPPSGLPVALAFAAAPAPPAPPPAFSAGGDSVVAAAVVTTSGCYDYGAAAGTSGGALVVTVTATEANRTCVAYSPPATARVTVHRAPRGRYEAVLQMRTVPLSGRAYSPIELGRGSVALP